MKRLAEKSPVSFTLQAILYPFMLVGAFLLAQGVKTAATNILFWTAILIPATAALYLAAAGIGLTVCLRVSHRTVVRATSVRLTAVAVNKTPFPMPFVEAVFTVPKKDSTECADHKFVFAMMPFSGVQLEKGGEFSFMGDYTVGCRELYVYDFFRAVRIRIPVNKMYRVCVLPRNIEVPPNMDIAAASDSIGSGKIGDDDLVGIREYRYGDNPRHIHWKLSSKSDVTSVREYAGGGGASSYILCDLYPLRAGSADTSDEVIKSVNKSCLDLTVEAALASVRRELEASDSAVIAYMDGDEPYFERIMSLEDADRVMRRLYHIQNNMQTAQLRTLAEHLAVPSDSTLICIGCNMDEESVNVVLELKDRFCRAEGCRYILCRDGYFCHNVGDEKTEDSLARLKENGVFASLAEDTF